AVSATSATTPFLLRPNIPPPRFGFSLDLAQSARKPNRGLRSSAMTTIGFVHTVLTLAPTFNALAEELVPEAERFHVADESLLAVTRREGSLSPVTRRRVLGYVESAADAGADLVVVTCSSIGPAVDAAREF